jgi:hypothetical protein
MPEQLHPPYAPASTNQPRQLIRWLDVNAQNGPLGKCQYYITLPAFNVPVTWAGFSDIVAAFNFEGIFNFSLTGGFTTNVDGSVNVNDLVAQIPVNPNYILCISWYDKNGMNRYSLWRSPNDVIFFNLLPYTNQLIKKKFRLEIWSTNVANVVQNVPINLYTSQLQQIDYRYGTDLPLVIADPIITSFAGNLANIGDLPNSHLGTLFRVKAASGLLPASPGNFVSWTDIVSGYVFQGEAGNSIVTKASGTLSGLNCASISSNTDYLSVNTASMNVQCLVLTARITGNEAANSFLFSAYPAGLTLFWNNGSVGNALVNVQGLSQNVWYTFVLFVVGGNISLYVYNTSNGTLVGNATGIIPGLVSTNEIVLGNAGIDILEALVGSGYPIGGTDLNQIINYMHAQYFTAGSAGLPITFPAGACSQSN